MLPISPQNDPIVEILRLAYRRGLALHQEQLKAVEDAINAGHVEKSQERKDVDALPNDGKRPDRGIGGVS